MKGRIKGETFKDVASRLSSTRKMYLQRYTSTTGKTRQGRMIYP